MNGGTCVDRVNAFSCNCRRGFTGVYCETGTFLIQRLSVTYDLFIQRHKYNYVTNKNKELC